MFKRKFQVFVACPTLLSFGILTPGQASCGAAQTGKSLDAIKHEASGLMKQQTYTEALPLLEQIVAAEPDNAESQSYLGFASIPKPNVTTDEAQT